MWMLISPRLRTWLLLALALPLARKLVHRLAVGARQRNPTSRTTNLLGRADSALTAVSQRSKRRR